MTQNKSHPSLNPNVLHARPSGIRRIADLAAKRATEGKIVYPLHLGEPDFDTPEPIKRSAIAALHAGHTHYTPNAGIAELRNAIGADLNHRYGTRLTSENIVVTVGACEALSIALMATLSPASEILVPTPCWPNYLQTPILLGARVRQIPTDAKSGFAIDPDSILSAVGPDTRAILINTPNNPTGATIDLETLSALLAGAKRLGVWVIVDEIYHDITFGARWRGVLEIVQPDDPIIYVNGFSKSYAMTGWRIGYTAAHKDVTTALTRIHQALVTSITSHVQYAAIEALRQHEAVEVMRASYTNRRNRIAARLQTAGFDFTVPAGGFYFFPKVPEGWRDGNQFTEDMLSQHGVALVPGATFGDAFQDRFRICFACEDHLLDQGIETIIRATRPTANDA